MASVERRRAAGPLRAGPGARLPPARDAALPAVAYFHGGGWAVGSIDSFDGVARRLAAASGAAVVSVGYSLAPEHPFPAPVEEGLAVVARPSPATAAASRSPATAPAVTSPP